LRAAVISDIHGNLYALEAVLDALEKDPPDEIWSLGDTIGYGPRPNRCAAIMQERANVALAGNHDLAILGATGVSDLNEFSHDAAVSGRWTQEVLSDEARSYLSGLEPLAKVDGAELFHASPRDPVWDYVLTAEGALDALDLTEAPLVLVGHSHVALAIGITAAALDGGLAPEGSEADLARGRWVLNPGSVGQPRDGDPRAAYLMIDFDAKRAQFRRVPYAVERTQAEIRERNLPEALAERLAHGL
jgi:diadenosine tetraphosphatase ApaH/serine/threonine PP2A family protein phosphatase